MYIIHLKPDQPEALSVRIDEREWGTKRASNSIWSSYQPTRLLLSFQVVHQNTQISSIPKGNYFGGEQRIYNDLFIHLQCYAFL